MLGLKFSYFMKRFLFWQNVKSYIIFSTFIFVIFIIIIYFFYYLILLVSVTISTCIIYNKFLLNITKLPYSFYFMFILRAANELNFWLVEIIGLRHYAQWVTFLFTPWLRECSDFRAPIMEILRFRSELRDSDWRVSDYNSAHTFLLSWIPSGICFPTIRNEHK